MIGVHYQKRKNQELFKKMEQPGGLFLSKPQNYLPLYSRFFQLNESNFNSINLNHPWHLTNVLERRKDGEAHLNVFRCKVKNVVSQAVVDKTVFFKMAPLLDPYKYLIGKYDHTSQKLMNLPSLHSTSEDCHPKLLDCNNSAYVDGMFVYLSGQLLDVHQFVHGIEYYGSFLAIKNNFQFNVFDDIDFLVTSKFFNQHKGILFQVEDYDHLFQQTESGKQPPITIGQNVSLKSVQTMDENLFEEIFDHGNFNPSSELEELDLRSKENSSNENVTLKTSSSCSSRSSHTDCEEHDEEYEEGGCENCDGCEEDDSMEDVDDASGGESEWTYEDSMFDDEEEFIYATIPQFPVQLIGMDCFEGTFDNWFAEAMGENESVPTQEALSAFMQIVMTLLTYQKAFQFTHNDLHGSNVMYAKTNKKYLYYCYNKKCYKVPTFGRIFKIIDFGRSIYKYDGKLFCSDSFQAGGDAATQYNTEPYFDDKKPRLEPNPSFDLCRLACSLFYHFADKYFEDKTDPTKKPDPVANLIFEWCMDDHGNNMLYKNNGMERYPEFKLYKMIARCVHHHTPEAQLERPEFAAYQCPRASVPVKDHLMDIDALPSMASASSNGSA